MRRGFLRGLARCGVRCGVLCALAAGSAHAGVVAGATRVIVREGAPDPSLMLANSNTYPVVVQTWVDGGEADPNVLAPFTSLPPVFHLAAGARAGLRVLLVDGEQLPRTRESVFWLNLHEIPPTPAAAAGDRLALSMNTQLKIFYRPRDLPPVEVAAQLRFTLVEDAGAWWVECDNPTPYHASFTTLEVVAGESATPVASEMDMMTPPLSRRRYALGDIAPAGDTLRFGLVDDAGFVQSHEVALWR